jgi:hypothetical protein
VTHFFWLSRPSCLFKKIIFSDTKKQLQQEVDELERNTALLTDADKEITLEIKTHDSDIKKLTTSFEGMASTMEGMARTIESLKNADNVLTANQKDNALRFHVETKLENVDWPQNTLINYKTKLTDTHNAMNTETGFFTAPFSGTYGFVFYARIYCDDVGRNLYIDHNGARSNIYHCYGGNSDDDSSSSIYFAISLKQGDEVGIFVETAYVSLVYFPAKFTGFLLQKN